MFDLESKIWKRHQPAGELAKEAGDLVSRVVEAGDPPLAADPSLGADRELDREFGDQDVDVWRARAGRRNAREKMTAGLQGLKHAVRGDSSFFAHAYRGILIALTAAMLGVGPLPWCLLVLAAALVLIAELFHSSVDTLARALGDPEEPGLKIAREISTGGVLVAVFVLAAVSITVFTVRLGELFSWW